MPTGTNETIKDLLTLRRTFVNNADQIIKEHAYFNLDLAYSSHPELGTKDVHY
jgi:hypothetical protein